MNRKLRPPTWIKNIPFAHRGLHNSERPENSLTAIAAAIKSRIGIELDVNISGDNQAMVFHDQDLKRMCGREDKLLDLNAVVLQQASLLQSYETIPTLIQALQLIAGKVPVLVELKGSGKPPFDLEIEVYRILKNYRGPIAVLSFNSNALAWFAREAPQIIRGKNCRRHGSNDTRTAPETDLADFYSYRCQDLPNREAENFRIKGYPLLGWTVTSVSEQLRVQDFVDNIIFEGFVP